MSALESWTSALKLEAAGAEAATRGRMSSRPLMHIPSPSKLKKTTVHSLIPDILKGREIALWPLHKS